jgi:hypothetical protein
MPTYYRSNETPSKQVIYDAIDLAERKRQTIRECSIISIFVLLIGVMVWLTS